MIKVDVKDSGQTTKVFNIEVSQEEVELAFSGTISKIQKKVKMPGFRPGRVPEDVITKNHAQEIHEEVLERLFSVSYSKALDDAKCVPIERPKVEKVELDRTKPLTYEVTVEVLPTVKLGNYKGSKLKANKIEVPEEDVMTVLENLRNQNAAFEIVEDRAAQNGDVVNIDFKGEKDGNSVAGTEGSDYRVELGAGQTIPDFENNIPGMNKGEVKIFDAAFPKDYHAKEMAGTTISFTITLKEIQQKKLAELDDTFAKDMGPFESLDALKDRIKEDLGHEKERQNKMLMTDQIMKDLAKNCQVTVPEVLVNRSLDKMLQEHEMNLQKQGKKLEDGDTTAEEFKDKNKKQVEQQLKAQLALREIGIVENIEVTDKEMDAEAERMALSSRQNPEAFKSYLTKNNSWEDIRDRIRDSKAIDLIIENGKISYN